MLTAPSYEQELMRVLEAVKQRPHTRLIASAQDEDVTEELETDAEQEQPNEIAAPALVARVTTKTLFSHPDTHPIVLDLALLYHYGADWLEWEPETVRFFLTDDVGQMSDLNFSKIMACRTLHMVDDFWQRWEVFVWCAMPFNAIFPDFNTMQVPTFAQCAVAVDVATRIRDDVRWSEEMTTYFQQVLLHDGLVLSVPPLDFVRTDDHYGVDVEEVKKAWPSVRTSGRAPAGATMVDEQLRRMLDVHQFLEESRARLRAQLPLVQYT